MNDVLAVLAEKGNLVEIVKVICATVSIACGASIAAIVQGFVISNSVSAIAKQPEASKNISSTMIIGLAMVESMAIYCLLISLLFLLIK